MAVLQEAKTFARPFVTGTPAPLGTFFATCIDIFDQFGVERLVHKDRARFKGETKKSDVTSFLFQFIGPDGQSYLIDSQEFTISIDQKANLRAFLTSWTGRPPQLGWDYCELLGKQALITVAQMLGKTTGKPYIAIASISPLPPGIPAPPPFPPTTSHRSAVESIPAQHQPPSQAPSPAAHPQAQFPAQPAYVPPPAQPAPLPGYPQPPAPFPGQPGYPQQPQQPQAWPQQPAAPQQPQAYPPQMPPQPAYPQYPQQPPVQMPPPLPPPPMSTPSQQFPGQPSGAPLPGGFVPPPPQAGPKDDLPF